LFFAKVMLIRRRFRRSNYSIFPLVFPLFRVFPVCRIFPFSLSRLHFQVFLLLISISQFSRFNFLFDFSDLVFSVSPFSVFSPLTLSASFSPFSVFSDFAFSTSDFPVFSVLSGVFSFAVFSLLFPFFFFFLYYLHSLLIAPTRFLILLFRVLHASNFPNFIFQVCEFAVETQN